MRYTVPALAIVIAACDASADSPALDSIAVPCPLVVDEYPLPVPFGSLFAVYDCIGDACFPSDQWYTDGDFLIVTGCRGIDIADHRVEVRYIAP